MRNSCSKSAAAGSGIAIRSPARRRQRWLSRRRPNNNSRVAASKPTNPPAVLNGTATSDCEAVDLSALTDGVDVVDGVVFAGLAGAGTASLKLGEGRRGCSAGAELGVGAGSGAGAVTVGGTGTSGTVSRHPGRIRFGFVSRCPPGCTVAEDALKISRSRVPTP